MTVSIVTAWRNHPELIADFEAAVTGARCLIIDQASAPDTAAALRAMVDRLGEGSTILRNEENRCISAAFNQGLAAVGTPVVVFLNNDVFGASAPENRWLHAVEFDVQPGGLYGPESHAFPVDDLTVPYLDGWCLAGHTQTFRELGGWDEINFPGFYAEDVELSWRAVRRGLSLFACPRWPIRHKGNQTSRTEPGAYDRAEVQRETFRQMVRAARTA